jgi:PAS domain S-box-containing protein
MFATDLENLTHQVHVTRAGQTGFAYLIDHKNRVIAHPDPVYANKLCDFSAYPPVKALRQGKRGLVSFIDEGGRHWRAYVNELNNGWGVVVQEQEEELLSTQRWFHQVALMIIITAVLILMCTTWWGVRRALKPINRLTEAVKKVTPENMSRLDFEFVSSASLNIRTKDEVGTLADSFYKMAVRLQATLASLEQELFERKRTEKELKKHRDSLEDLVRERTTNLTNSNEQLNYEIEERKRVEVALLESQQMLRLVLDSIPVRVSWKDKELNYLGCNQQFANDSGFGSPEEIIGKNDFAMGWAEQAEIYRSDDRMVIETGVQKLNYEEPQTTPDGRKIWLRTSKMPLIDAEGRIKGVLGTYEDITNPKRAELELKESEERYRLLAENAHDIIFTMDVNLRFTYISPSITRIRGFTAEEAMSQTPAEALTPASLEVAMKAFLEELEIEARETKDLWRTRAMELEETCKDGSTIWTETTFSPLRDENYKFTGFLGITRDITKRKKAEEDLRKSEESYRFITDNMRDTIWLMDMDFRPIWISPSVVRNRGFTLEELINMPMEKNLTPGAMQIVTQIINNHFTPEKLDDKNHEMTLSGELEFYRKDGSTLWSDVVMSGRREEEARRSTSPSPEDGIHRDIGRRHRT